MSLTRIVAATDFSTWAAQAADRAVDLARRFASELVLIHVDSMPIFGTVAVEPMYLPPAWLEPLRRHHDETVAESLERERTRLALAAPGLSVRSELRLGDPAESICEAARDLGADLVVMATRGASASRFLLGSVAAHVAQRCPCPVLVSPRRDGTPPLGMSRILVAVDYSAFSRPAVELARRLLSAGGSLELAHVWSEPHMFFRSHADRAAMAAERERGELTELEGFALECDLAPSARELWVAGGNPAARILDRADETSADLVVLGAHGRKLGARLLGTVADRVLRHATCAVLVLPEAALEPIATAQAQGGAR